MTDVLEGLGGVLAANVDEDLFSAAVEEEAVSFVSGVSCAGYVRVGSRCGTGRERKGPGSNVRMLINEAARVVDEIVDDNIEVLLRGVGGNFLVGEFLRVGHGFLSSLSVSPFLPVPALLGGFSVQSRASASRGLLISSSHVGGCARIDVEMLAKFEREVR